MTDVTLTWTEVVIAAHVGVQRRVRGLAGGWTERYPDRKQNEWTRHIDGACAEMAVAKHLGIYWGEHVEAFKAPDVGPFQVRHTTHDHGCLLVYLEDADDQPFILVTGRPPTFVIRGSMSGRDAKQAEWFRDKPEVWHPGFFVPQDALQAVAS